MLVDRLRRCYWNENNFLNLFLFLSLNQGFISFFCTHVATKVLLFTIVASELKNSKHISFEIVILSRPFETLDALNISPRRKTIMPNIFRHINEDPIIAIKTNVENLIYRDMARAQEVMYIPKFNGLHAKALPSYVPPRHSTSHPLSLKYSNELILNETAKRKCKNFRCANET